MRLAILLLEDGNIVAVRKAMSMFVRSRCGGVLTYRDVRPVGLSEGTFVIEICV